MEIFTARDVGVPEYGSRQSGAKDSVDALMPLF